jgi:hypothetical protein
MNKWLEWMHSKEYAELSEAEEKFLAEHWANDLLDAPHALIAMIETKIARAELQAEKRTEERIIKLLKDGEGWNKNDRCDCTICANRRAIEQVKVERLIKRIKGEQK